MAVLPRIIPDDINFDFVRQRKVAMSLSLVLVLVSLLLIGIKGVVLGADFTGGMVVDFQLDEGSTSIDQVRSVFVETSLRGLSVQALGEGGREFIVIFRGGMEGPQAVDEVKNALETIGKITYNKLDYVGAQVGAGQIVKGVTAVLCSLFGMFLYLCCRFQWRFAVGGVLALMHDVVITMGIVSATGIEFGLPATAAVLMIIGYSVNDSVVIYDRIRGLMRDNESQDQMDQIINAGINSTLSRTLLTSGTTLLAAIPLILLCEGAVRDLGIIAVCGIVVGTYSSIFVSALLLTGGAHQAVKRRIRKNAA
ncbi:MAG: protein translocase subunit SecF [Anaplasma sp.]